MSSALITGPLADALARGREHYNALFAQAKISGARVDESELAAHLHTTLSPIIDAVASVDPAAVYRVTDALFPMSLDLLAKDLIGSSSRYPVVGAGWSRLLPRTAHLLVRAPREIAAAVTNALYNLASTAGASAEFWLAEMPVIASHCTGVSELLDAGAVVAWRGGMAHQREAALERCAELSPDLAALALGVDGGMTSFGALLERLRRNPWLDPNEASRESAEEANVRIVSVAGAFRGFGGPFRVPPKVALVDSHFVAADDTASWTLFADRFGATWHRSRATVSGQRPVIAGVSVASEGKVTMDRRAASLPELANATSWAFDGVTLAVTVPLSHSIYLVARTP